MKFVFLAAADNTPLTKTFSQSFGTLHKSAYPNVRNFNSYEEDCSSLLDIFGAISAHAEAHHCLLKGRLNRPLQNESRQGSTNSQSETDWIVFDIDHLPGIATPEDFIALLPTSFHNTSYILQYSASAGFSQDPEIRAHLFFRLTNPVMAPTLKLWMKNLNLNVETFAQHLRLAEGGCTLKWPVDISVNQNDKLIYIAPPILVDVADPLTTQRIQLIVKEAETVTLDVNLNAESIRTAEGNKINALREMAGLERRRIRIEHTDGYQVITNADQFTLSSPPFEERGFVYFPMGNNRHTFYHPVGRHSLIFSFRDPELAFSTRQVLPAYYWEQERQHADSATNGQTLLVFRDARTDVKHIGYYTNDLNFVNLNQIRAREDIDDFYKQHHQPTPELIPTWDYTFDPTTDVRIDPTRRWVNKFVASDYMGTKLGTVTEMPDKLRRLILHVCGSDRLSFDYFINWLAWKFQTRGKCKTAWFFQGVEGTGKGVLFAKVIAPLFGPAYCHLKRMDALTDRFNAELETSLIWAIDEANIEDFKDANMITEKLKNLITEDTQVIRAMRTNPFNAINYTDILLFSNRSLAIRLSETDRRYNICPRQTKKLLTVLTADEINEIEQELPRFAAYLLSYRANEAAAHQPLQNVARGEAIAVSQTAQDEFFGSLLNGNLTYFMTGLNDLSNTMMDRQRQEAENAVQRWSKLALTEPAQSIPLQELANVYSTLIHPGKAVLITSAKMSRLLGTHAIHVTTHANGLTAHIEVVWNVAETTLHTWLTTRTNSTGGTHGQQGSFATH